MMLQMVKVICSHCRQTIERGSGQNLNSLSCIQCVCLKCYENASSSDLRYKKLKQELDKAHKKNQQLEKKCQNYQKELSQTNKSFQRCKKSKQGLEKNARMMENLVNKQLAQQMDRFTHFIDEILNREDCLQNFVTISIENLSSDIYKYASTLIERQTNFLLDILRTQIQNNSTLEYAMKQYSLNLKETFKTLSIKSNFSEDLMKKDHEMDKETAFLHQNKAKYFAQKETQTIEKIIRRKILSLKQRQEQLGFLIDMGHYISIKYVFKRRAERKIEEVSSKPKKEETLKPKQEISFKTNKREENIWKPNEEDSSKPKEENFLKPKEEDNQKPNEKEEDNVSAGNKENADEFAMLNASESSKQGWSSDSHYENLTELEKPLEVKQNSTDINDCDQYW